MTKHEAAVVMAYTGITIGSFEDFQNYAEKLIGRPIWTHQFADKDLGAKIHELSKPDFMKLVVEDKDD